MAGLPPQPIGQSQAYLAILDRVSDSAVGEHGTGKELIAKRLHFLSPRWEKTFITVNCAAFTDERLDEELFGQSFLDGREDTNGKFYHADEGTIFLDNIDAVSPRLQEKLMGAVEYGRYEASGENAEQEVDVRVITASCIDLPASVARGEFPLCVRDAMIFCHSRIISDERLPQNSALRVFRDLPPKPVRHSSRGFGREMSAN